jgi:TRAP-type C4-dicarboxylate transport system permease small subunit
MSVSSGIRQVRSRVSEQKCDPRPRQKLLCVARGKSHHGGRMVRTFLDRLYLLAGYAAGAFLVLIFGIMMFMSVGRQFGFNIPAGDDFASWCMAAMAFLGLAHTFKKGEIIRVGVLIEQVTGRRRWFLEIAALGISTAFTLYFTWSALMTYDSFRFNDMAQACSRCRCGFRNSAIAAVWPSSPSRWSMR